MPLQSDWVNWTAILTAIENVALPHRGEGNVANYTPAPATLDPMQFGMCMVTGN